MPPDEVRVRAPVPPSAGGADEFVLDVGFDPPAGVEPDRLQGPALLAFAGIDPVVVPALPLEFGVAEKVHAYSRTYGDRVLASTRVKDLVDLVLIASEAALDAGRLREALEVTFDRRATHPLPVRLPRPPADWRVPYGHMCRDIGLEPDLGAGHDLVASLVDPVLAGDITSARWDPSTRRWRP